MRTLVLAFAVATLISVVLIPLVRKLAYRLGAVSVPGGRHVHGRVIPRLGGVAIVVSFAVTLGILVMHDDTVRRLFLANRLLLMGLLVGGGAMATVGVIDDTRGLRAIVKLGAQIAVAVFAYGCGFRIDGVHLPIAGDLWMGIFALPVTVLWIVGIVNAVNLIDGLDGLAAGVVFFAGITNVTVAHLTGYVLNEVLMVTMLGAVLGFLFFNFNPARIFMGDSGSYFLGFVLAAMALCAPAQKASTAVSILVPVLALGVPILDTLFSVVRRFLERRPIFSPDRGHIHHRLLDMGLTHRRAVLILYALSMVFTAAAIAVSLGRSWTVGAAILGAAAAMAGVVRFVGYFDYLHRVRRQKSRLRTRDTERLRRVIPELAVTLREHPPEAEVWAIFEDALSRAQLACFDVVKREADDSARAWQSSTFSGARIIDYVSARFPLGETGSYDIRFRWESEFGDVNPQSEVLLQVAVDLLTDALVRSRSEYAPPPLAEDVAREGTPRFALAASEIDP